jgi:ankyrin repeat protein
VNKDGDPPADASEAPSGARAGVRATACASFSGLGDVRIFYACDGERGVPEEDIISLISRDDRAALAQLLARHPDAARARGPDGVSALLHAVYRGRREIAELLDAAGAERDVFNSAGLGKCERLRSLLDANPRLLEARSADGWTPLHLAAFFGHADAVRYLLERGADPRALSSNAQSNHPLHAACAGGGVQAALALIASGADPGYAAQGFTPLHIASANGLREVVRALLDAGADPAVRDPSGKTPGDHARGRGHTELAQMLDDAGP